MAPTVLQMLGNTRFLAFYMGGEHAPYSSRDSFTKVLYLLAGAVASGISLFWNSVVKKNPSNYSSHGASGEYRAHRFSPGGSS